jgi:hypothetical protein
VISAGRSAGPGRPRPRSSAGPAAAGTRWWSRSCKPLYELTYAARLLDWGFDEDGKVKPVGMLVPPLPAHTVAHRLAPRAKPKALPPPAKLGLPGIPLMAGLGTIALAGLTVVTVAVVTRRGRRAGSPPGP